MSEAFGRSLLLFLLNALNVTILSLQARQSARGVKQALVQCRSLPPMHGVFRFCFQCDFDVHARSN